MNTLPLSRDQIAAIQARAARAVTPFALSVVAAESMNALCAQSLRAIELEAEKQELAMQALSLSGELETLQSELAATRKALEEERERYAKALEAAQSETDGARRRLAAERGRTHYEKVKRRWTQWEP